MTFHAVVSGNVVFVVLGVIQIIVSSIILGFSVKYPHSVCETDLKNPAA